jgi:1-acyl-sn-glycerol-3-phosphate acyltransferase
MPSSLKPPHPVQFQGSRFARWLLRLAGWRVHFEGLPARQGVLVVYPHTSNWDFIVLILAKWSVGIPVRFWAKDKLFSVPLFGPWMRWLGGVPVERTSSRGVVGQTVEEFAQARGQSQYFWLALAPEGTRKRLPGWRSGFYQTAVRAGAPLGIARLDYGRREVRALDFIQLSGDEAQDFSAIARAYEGVSGRIPQNAAPIRLLDPSIPRDQTIVR